MAADVRHVVFARIAADALHSADRIVKRWLPDGRRNGVEWIARNPKRADRHLGSFKINLRTGRWADFATSAAGGDLISLGAYLFDLGQGEAARRVADMLGVDAYDS
jgi:hypothetical protein